ncbi:MAG: TetR/AcrR family transcriptional regulator [Thermoleophilia bacterium]
MSIDAPYEQTGRTRQKARTRAALVEATRTLLDDGVTPTVEAAADAAGVSRTTAYRYFPNQRALWAAVYPISDEASLLPADAPQDVEGRVEALVDALAREILAHEGQLRASLHVALHPSARRPTDLPLRAGRARAWIAEALSPLRDALDADELDRLTLAIRTAVGIESLVWLTDVAGLTREEAVEQMRWTALSLVRAARGRD